MRKVLTAFVASSIVFTASLSASIIGFTSGTGFADALQSDGVSTLTSAGAGAFTFQLGTFDEAVLSGTADTWATGFNNEMTGDNVWGTFGPAIGRFLGDQTMDDASSNGAAAYIFGFNADTSQIILFKNAAWVFPAFDSFDLSADLFSLEDANTQILQADGTFASIGSNIQMLAAVPEPSVFALFSGAMALGWVMVRRRRAL